MNQTMTNDSDMPVLTPELVRALGNDPGDWMGDLMFEAFDALYAIETGRTVCIPATDPRLSVTEEEMAVIERIRNRTRDGIGRA